MAAVLYESVLKRYGPLGVAVVALALAGVGYIKAQTELLQMQAEQARTAESGGDVQAVLDELDRRMFFVDRRLQWLEEKLVTQLYGDGLRERSEGSSPPSPVPPNEADYSDAD